MISKRELQILERCGGFIRYYSTASLDGYPKSSFDGHRLYRLGVVRAHTQ